MPMADGDRSEKALSDFESQVIEFFCYGSKFWAFRNRLGKSMACFSSLRIQFPSMIWYVAWGLAKDQRVRVYGP